MHLHHVAVTVDENGLQHLLPRMLLRLLHLLRSPWMLHHQLLLLLLQ